MTFDPEALLSWQVPDREHVVETLDTAFYALSVGLGSTPLDRRTLRFVDPVSASASSPGMALVLGYPGFWLGSTTTGVNAARILHVSQRIDILRPLPVAGTFKGVTRVMCLEDRGTGRGAVLTSERIILHDGVEVARLEQKHLLRDEGGFKPAADNVDMGRITPQGDPCQDLHFLLPEDAALLYRLNGDHNPLHADPDIARAAGFNRPIMHGMGLMGYAIAALLRDVFDFDVKSLTGIWTKFVSPSYPGDQLQLLVWPGGEFRVLNRATDAVLCEGMSSPVSSPPSDSSS